MWPPDWSVVVRAASERDLELADAHHHANTEDGASAIFVNGSLVGIGNEYGTVRLRAPSSSPRRSISDISKDALEDLVEAVGRFMEVTDV